MRFVLYVICKLVKGDEAAYVQQYFFLLELYWIKKKNHQLETLVETVAVEVSRDAYIVFCNDQHTVTVKLMMTSVSL
jgi:hypothetical protein